MKWVLVVAAILDPSHKQSSPGWTSLADCFTAADQVMEKYEHQVHAECVPDLPKKLELPHPRGIQ